MTFKQHFQLENLYPLHDNPTVFIASQWQFDKSQPSIIHLLYRTVVTIFIITTWCLSFDFGSWGIYLTNWGYTMCALQFLFGFLLLFCSTVITKIFVKPGVHNMILRLYPLYWIAHSAAVSTGFMITIIFWALLYDARIMPFSALNFFVHGSNSILLMVDLCIIGHPIRILHFVYPLLFGIIYLIFSIAYYFYEQNRGRHGIIYPILDWNYPGSTTLLVVGIFFLVIFLHLFSFGIHYLKVKIHARLYIPQIQPTESNTMSTEQLNEVV